jgi:uncharacterized protein (TIRG00374 family)
MHRRRGWAFWVGLAISLGCVVWASFSLDWRQIMVALRQADWVWLLFAVVAVLLRIATRAARWRSLFVKTPPGYLVSLTALLVGQTFNYVAPTWAGDLTRAYLVGERTGRKTGCAFGTVVVEKVLDLALFLSFLALLSLCMELPDWLELPARTLGLMALAGLVVFVLGLLQRASVERLLAWAFRPLPVGWRERALGFAGQLLDGLAALRSPRSLAQAGFWSLGLWGWDAAAHYAVLRAVGLRLPILAPLLLSTALRAAFAVSAVPGQIGVYEGIVVLSLGLFGEIGAPVALAVGLLRHVIDFVPPALAALLLLVAGRPSQGDLLPE